ncbi:MAG TPA: nucleoside hydrolase [Phenylobacterium sp.]|nr:nucleoside hydrolase [Phenylobacterium sp.]
MSAKSLIIDCDPGVDDAIALFLAFGSPELDLIGITTVAGNVSAALTARNARLIRQVAGREDVPVIAGADRPLVRLPVEADHFHGESGLGRLPVFEPDAPLAEGQAADFIAAEVMRRPAGSVTLAVTGPMTNLALAFEREPALPARLAAVVAMGGARSEGGNITASAEYNIHADPHAAQAVAASGCRLVMLGLDVTHQVRATPERIARIAGVATPQARAVADLLDFAVETERRFVEGGAPPLHDPCTIAYILRPDLFTTRPCRLEVETQSALTLGHTAVEFRVDPASATCQWATWADAEAVFALITERLGA